MKKSIAVLLAVVLVVSLAACGSPKATYNDAGYYEIYTMTEAGETMTKAELESLGLTMYLELKDDGTGVLDMAGDATDITWSDGSLTAEGDTVNYVIAGGILTLDLSDDGEEFVLLFKKGTKPADGSSSSGGLKGMLTGGGAEEPADEPEEEPEDEPADVPASSAGAEFTPVGGDMGNGYVEIVTAEQFTDSDGKDAIRFYFDFTSYSDMPTNAWWECNFYAEQDGHELVDTYANWEDDVPEYGNTSRYVLTDVTIRCIAEFNFVADGGDVIFRIYNGDDEVEAVFDPRNLPGRLGDWEPDPYEDDYLDGMSDSIETDEFTIYVDNAEYAESYFDDEELIRVYFDYTNLTDEDDSCYMAMYIAAFQDGIGLDDGYSSEDLESDDLYTEYVAGGESVTCSHCWELRDHDTPIEVVVFDLWSDTVYGGATYSNDN